MTPAAALFEAARAKARKAYRIAPKGQKRRARAEYTRATHAALRAEVTR
jgi:hypothetical protein